MSAIAYANLSLDGQSLLLPQGDVQHIALRSDIQLYQGEESGPGFVEHDGHEWPVHTLDRGLAPLAAVPGQRRLVACIGEGEKRLALACDMLTTVRPDPEAIVDELQAMMRLQSSPIQALLYANRALHYLSSATALFDYLLGGEG